MSKKKQITPEEFADKVEAAMEKHFGGPVEIIEKSWDRPPAKLDDDMSLFAPFKDDRTRFFIQCKGDPSVGISGCDAEVLMWAPSLEDDPDYLAFIKQQLATAFEAIWDGKVRVLTEAECCPDDHDEEMIERRGG